MFPLFRRRSQQKAIISLYNKVIAQARLPCFYRDYAVADTVNGRFDLIVPHVALVLAADDSASTPTAHPVRCCWAAPL
jgi:cytochrome b pre-mRNA-processing protein 3